MAQIRSGADDVIRSVDTIAAVITEQVRVTREMVSRVESVSTGTGALSANAGRSAVAAATWSNWRGHWINCRRASMSLEPGLVPSEYRSPL
ncbi:MULTISPECIES: hypothetical protein [unclassified Pseudomonas]|uniref:Methyl-accepting transducer domain-containing protein n=1 Tax=Pseudomonas sp. MYb327 TaxID=2745230 RepID=A0AAU8E5H7_9PSED